MSEPAAQPAAPAANAPAANAPAAQPVAATTPSSATTITTPPAANAPAPAPGGTPVAGPGGAPTDPGAQPTPADWTQSLNPDLQTYVAKKGFKDPSSVLESYVNLEKLRGVPEDRLLKLPEHPDAPEWNDVYTRLGKPASADDYGIVAPEGDTSGFADWAKDAFHGLNLTTDQAQQLMKGYEAFSAKHMEAKETEYQNQFEAKQKALRQEWGSAYDEKLKHANTAVKKFGIDQDQVAALERTMGADVFAKVMSQVGQYMGEDGFVGGASGGQLAMTPAQAKAELQTLKADKNWLNKFASGDVKAREEKAKLDRIIASAMHG
jgi:hypothetical protein